MKTTMKTTKTTTKKTTTTQPPPFVPGDEAVQLMRELRAAGGRGDPHQQTRLSITEASGPSDAWDGAHLLLEMASSLPETAPKDLELRAVTCAAALLLRYVERRGWGPEDYVREQKRVALLPREKAA